MKVKRWIQSAIFSFSSPDKWNEGDKEGEQKKEDSKEVGRGFSITFIDTIVDAGYEIMRGDQIRESCELGSKSHLSILLYLNRPKIQYMQA